MINQPRQLELSGGGNLYSPTWYASERVVRIWEISFIAFLTLLLILIVATIISLIINGVMLHNIKKIVKMGKKTLNNGTDKASSFNNNPHFKSN